MRNILVAALVGLAAPYGVACSSGSSSSGPSDAAPVTAAVTFHKDVEPILQEKCQGCHVRGGIGPFALTTFAEARAVAADIVIQTSARNMPPWHAESTDECSPPFPWKNDLRLTEAQLDTLKAWHAAGEPEGDPKEAPAARAQTIGLSDVGLRLQPETPYALDARSDQFRCFVLDPKLAADAYVNGVSVVPGDSTVVHHVLVYIDPSGQSRAKADAAGGYDCFGGPGLDDPDLLTAWAPGGVPLEYPSNVAVPISKGSLLVMQVHYHPHVVVGAVEDSTTVELRFGDTAPEYRAVSKLIGNFRIPFPDGDGLLAGPDDPPSGPEFLIPAGATHHVESMAFALTADRLAALGRPRLYGVGAHMHLAGTDEMISVARADGTTQCLLQVPRWDFNWQRRYDYDAPLTELLALSPGDRLEMRCTYDNSMGNPKIVEALRDQNETVPHDIALGETTLDEMCLAALTGLVGN